MTTTATPTTTEATVAEILNENYDGVFDLNTRNDFTWLVQRIVRMIQTNDSQDKVRIQIWGTLLPREHPAKNSLHAAYETSERIGQTFGMRL